MGGVSAGAASAVMCAVMSLSWAGAGPAQAVGDGTAGPAGSIAGGAGSAVGDVESAVDGSIGDAGRTVSGTVGDARRTVSGTAGDARRTVSGTAGDARRTVSGTAGDARRTVAGTAGGRVLPESPPAALPAPRSASPSGTSAPHDASEPDSAHGDGVARAAGAAPAKDTTPAAPHRARRQTDRDRARPHHVSPAAATAARRLIVAWMRLDRRLHPSIVDRGERSVVAIPQGLHDDSCRSGSLAVRDLRRCAFASTRIPQLGGPSSALLSMGLAMIGAGVVLVARRRRVTPGGPALG